jgi:hypothetical protein
MSLATKEFLKIPIFKIDEDLFTFTLLKLLNNSDFEVVFNTFESLINMMRVDEKIPEMLLK